MKPTIILLLLALTFSCQQPAVVISAKLEIENLMAEQESAWNKADINGFMKHYWQSDSLEFIGKKGLTYGWQATLDNYKKSYPDASAMGRLQFTNLKIEDLNPHNVYVVGKWQLFRMADTLSGHYTLLWQKKNNHWVIVSDHSS
jgi:ketosteroid isomerase-like protein